MRCPGRRAAGIHRRGQGRTAAAGPEWAPKIATLARDTNETHVLFNNCYRNYAQVNAQQLAALLSAGHPS